MKMRRRPLGKEFPVGGMEEMEMCIGLGKMTDRVSWMITVSLRVTKSQASCLR